MLQPISIDSSDFPEMREKGCVYVDKTAYFHKLISGQKMLFYLARPRRLGKSLMISTLKAIFDGRRKLFEGLEISKTDWTWEKYPVLYFNFINAAAATAEEFRQLFLVEVERGITEAGGTFNPQWLAAGNFGRAIDALSAANNGKGAVILIDEYDAPVARLLDKPDEAEMVRGMLADFYSQMKDRTGRIRFLMITGVSKFTKMSVFSALSNLFDISFEDDYATMLGYTEDELDAFFGEHLRAHADVMNMPYDVYRAELKRWFNGYRFGKYNNETVYNPVSVGMNLFKKEPEFRPCWSQTGKASMLMNSLKRDDFLAIDMEKIHDVDENDFDMADVRALKPVPLLFQTGYLTIDKYNRQTQSYSLCVPNNEVRKDLATLTAAVIANRGTDWVSSLGRKLLGARWSDFFDGLRALYASLPYGPKEKSVQEYSYERNLLVLLKAQAIRCTTEDRQANGQADIVAMHPCGVFIFELKVDESAEAALEQVRKKGYDTPYHGDGTPIWIIGLNFDSQTHHLLDAKAEKLA